jgi:hypothetical protein
MIPPIVKSVKVLESGHAKRAAEPLAVKTQLPLDAPTGSTATQSFPLVLRNTLKCIWPKPATRWVQTKDPITSMISIN